MPKKPIFNPTTGKLDFVSEEDLSGYVPYTGATGNVNLGTYSILSRDIKINDNAYNIILGYEAGTYANADTQQFNTILGRRAGGYVGSSNVAFDHNTAIGYQAMTTIGASTYNTAIGSNALQQSAGALGNVAIGYSALYNNYGGDYNIAIGYEALKGTVAGTNNNNTVIGYQAGTLIQTGSNNIIIGYKAGDNLTTGSNNIIIGYDQDADAVGMANKIIIGNSSITDARIYGDLNLENNTMTFDKDGDTGLMKHTTTTGAISYITDNSANWNTAYGWGNHASAGYLTSLDCKSSFRVYSTEAQRISNDAWIPVLYQEMNWDLSNEFDFKDTVYKWIVREDGLYDIKARVRFGTIPEMEDYGSSWIGIRFMKNDNVWSNGGRKVGGDHSRPFPDEYYEVMHTDKIWLVAEDQVWVEVYQINDSKSDWELVAGTEETYFSQHKFNSSTKFIN